MAYVTAPTIYSNRRAMFSCLEHSARTLWQAEAFAQNWSLSANFCDILARARRKAKTCRQGTGRISTAMWDFLSRFRAPVTCVRAALNTFRAHEKGAQTGDDTIRSAQIGAHVWSAIEDPQLMFDEHRLGNDGTEASWPC